MQSSFSSDEMKNTNIPSHSEGKIKSPRKTSFENDAVVEKDVVVQAATFGSDAAEPEQFFLFFVVLGATPKGRFTEQHDVFVGIHKDLAELLPHMEDSWPEAEGRIHIDSWRKVTRVGDFRISIVPKGRNLSISPNKTSTLKLYFLNLGGYKPGDLEEYHYKLLVVANNKADAIRQAKETTFYKHTGFKGAESHIDDEWGVDVDDIHLIQDMLQPAFKNSFSIQIEPVEVPLSSQFFSPDENKYTSSATPFPEDELHIGYISKQKLKKKTTGK